MYNGKIEIFRSIELNKKLIKLENALQTINYASKALGLRVKSLRLRTVGLQEFRTSDFALNNCYPTNS